MRTITPSTKRELSRKKPARFTPSSEMMPLNASRTMMLPVQPGAMPQVEFLVDVKTKTTLHAELRISTMPEGHTPDVILASQRIDLKPGRRIKLPLNFNTQIGVPRHAFVCLMANPNVAVHMSDERLKRCA